MCVAGAPALSAEPSGLPGPGLDVPVDADGDGVSSYGDRYAFNYWLALGGDLAKALAAAEAGKNGVIDLSKFFGSADALLAPQSTDAEAELLQESAAGGGTPLTTGCGTSGCATSASIIEPFGAPTTPASLFTSCQELLSYPTGAEMDPKQGEMDSKQDLWISRVDPTQPDHSKSGVALLHLSQAPPMGNDGTIPLASPEITNEWMFEAEDIVVRTVPPIPCRNAPYGSSIHSMSTWPGDHLICPTMRRDSTGELCGSCGLVIIPETEPFAIDAVRAGMPGDFGVPEDIVFSAKEGATLWIRRGQTPPPPNNSCYEGIPLVTVSNLTSLSGVFKAWGLALGDFNGAGDFGAYLVAQPTSGSLLRVVRKLYWDQQTSTWSNPFFASLTGLSPNAARSIAFDPLSGDLFVSEDQAVTGPQARIWRIGKTGTVRLFGQNFNKPNGIAFHPSGVMLVAEQARDEPTKGNVLVVGGWRNLFKRGDANGSGTVDISDPIFISNWINQGGPVPPCLDGADADDDCKVLDADAQYILAYLFSGGPAPPIPGPSTCGRDPTPDLLDCTLSLGAGCAIQ